MNCPKLIDANGHTWWKFDGKWRQMIHDPKVPDPVLPARPVRQFWIISDGSDLGMRLYGPKLWHTEPSL